MCATSRKPHQRHTPRPTSAQLAPLPYDRLTARVALHTTELELELELAWIHAPALTPGIHVHII